LKFSEETKKKISIANSGKNNGCYIGGGSYDHYAPLLFDEETQRDPDKPKAIQVKCKLNTCRKWFTPTANQCGYRLKGTDNGTQYIYCSDEHKYSCPTYRKIKHPSGMNPRGERGEIVNPLFRKMVLEKDNHQCVRCETNKNLKAHHIQGVAINPMIANDVDNGITFCGDCHDWIHSRDGCKFSDYRRIDDCYSN